MENRIALRIASVVLIAIAFVTHSAMDIPIWSDNFMVMVEPSVPQKYKGEITVGGKEGIYSEVDGASHFLEEYRAAWELCRETYYNGGELYWEDEGEQIGPWLNIGVGPGNMIDAHKLGWTICRDQIENLRQKHSDHEIRQNLTRLPIKPLAVGGLGFIIGLASFVGLRPRRST